MFTHMNRRFCLKHHSHSVVDLLSWRRFQTLGTPNWVFVQFERGRIQGDCMKHCISEPFGLSSRFAAYRSRRTAWSRLRYASARLLSPNGQGVFHAQACQRSVVIRLHAIALGAYKTALTCKRDGSSHQGNCIGKNRKESESVFEQAIPGTRMCFYLRVHLNDRGFCSPGRTKRNSNSAGAGAGALKRSTPSR